MTTTTVSLDGLRELAGFRAQNGCAISLYVDLDPAISPTTRETTMRVHAMLDSAAKSHGATRPDLAHEVKAGLKADFERLGQYFDGEFDRDGAHGLAVFAAGPRQRLERARAALEGRRRGSGRGRLPAQPARAADRARQRCDRRRRRPGAGTRARAARRPLRAGRRPDRGDAGQARPGRLVAVALPAPHRESRPGALQGRRRGARTALPAARTAADHRCRGRRDPRRVRRCPLVGARGRRDRVDERRCARFRRRARRGRAAVRRPVAGRAGVRSARALARGGGQERARVVRLGRDARGGFRRPSGAAAPSGRRADGRVPLPGLWPRRRRRVDLPARRDDDGAPRRRARSRRPADARLRRRAARRSRAARISIPSRGSARFCASRPRRSPAAARPARAPAASGAARARDSAAGAPCPTRRTLRACVPSAATASRASRPSR